MLARYTLIVIPAKAGIQFQLPSWIPAFAGMTMELGRPNQARRPSTTFSGPIDRM
ncbi:MAG: hypothetical protein JWR77_2139 [Rhizorhabdus sp.]|nr:hypothetical protein [Rhizorhabdus sp.]